MIQPKMRLVIGRAANPNMRGKLVRELMEDYRVETCGLAITIPAGFQTDGASIPEGLQWLVGGSFANEFRAAALVHDYLYYTHWAMSRNKTITIDRIDADACLLDLLEQNKVGWIRRQSIYRAVRIFGGSYWDNDNNDRAYLTGLAAQIVARGGQPQLYGLAA